MKTHVMQSLGVNKEQEKKEAQEIFNNLEIPSLKYGQGIQVLLKELDLNKVIAKPNEEERMNISAPKEVGIQSLQEISKEEWKKISSLISPKENKFLALHYSILEDCKIITIPKDTTLKEPIIISSHITKKAKAESIIIIAESNTQANIIEESTSTKEAYYKTQTVQIIAKQNAQISFSSVQNLSKETYNFVIKRGKADTQATILWNDAILGSKYTHLRIKSFASSPHANTEIYTTSFAEENQLFDIDTQSHHTCKQTSSQMFSKSVLIKNARTIYQGKIRIEKGAKNCKAKQKSENLLLGKHARCDAVPILEVENDEVSCSHGASIGKLDEEKVFYCISRGIEEKAARNMVIQGFLEPIIQKFPSQETQETIRKEIARKVQNE